jgi:hypothetical protein
MRTLTGELSFPTLAIILLVAAQEGQPGDERGARGASLTGHGAHPARASCPTTRAASRPASSP